MKRSGPSPRDDSSNAQAEFVGQAGASLGARRVARSAAHRLERSASLGAQRGHRSAALERTHCTFVYALGERPCSQSDGDERFDRGLGAATRLANDLVRGALRELRSPPKKHTRIDVADPKCRIEEDARASEGVLTRRREGVGTGVAQAALRSPSNFGFMKASAAPPKSLPGSGDARRPSRRPASTLHAAHGSSKSSCRARQRP